MSLSDGYLLDEEFVMAVAEVVKRFRPPTKDDRFRRRISPVTELLFAYLRKTGGTGSEPASFTYDLYANQTDATAGTGTPLFTGVGLSTALKRKPVDFLQADDGSECWYRVLPDTSNSNKPTAKIVILGEIPDGTACATADSGDGDDEADGGDM